MHKEIAIEAKHLTKSYGALTALRDFNISVQPKTVFGLLGENGAGKSTAIGCILGIKAADAGSVSILGMHPRENRKELFEQVGVQFQECSYPDKITVRELCEITTALYRAPACYRSLLAQFGIAHKSTSAVSALSGGERQRMFIVLALIPNPRVVFLDELTTGLDTKARRDVWQTLSALKASGLTILLTSHFMDEVEVLCDEILILKQGKTIFRGTVPQAVAASPCDNFEDAYLWFTRQEGETI